MSNVMSTAAGVAVGICIRLLPSLVKWRVLFVVIVQNMLSVAFLDVLPVRVFAARGVGLDLGLEPYISSRSTNQLEPRRGRPAL